MKEFQDYKPIIAKLSYRYALAAGDLSLIDDLSQEAFIVYCYSVQDYDESKAAFDTYYINRLGWHFAQYISRQERRFSLSIGNTEKYLRIRRFISDYEQEHGEQPTDARIAKDLDLPLQKVIYLKRNSNFRSLYEPVEGDILLEDVIEAPYDALKAVDDKIYLEQVRTALSGVIDDLEPIEQQVIAMKYEQGMKMKEIADRIGKSFNQTRHILYTALAKLRKPDSVNRLVEVLDVSTNADRLYYMGGQGFYNSYGSVVEFIALRE